jgi:hypothetical protein
MSKPGLPSHCVRRTGHCAPVVLRVLVLGFLLSVTSAQAALAGGNEAPTRNGDLDCQMPIGGAFSLPGYVAPFGDAVALQASSSNSQALQTSRDPSAKVAFLRYFAKSPLFLRTQHGRAAIVVSRRDRGHVALTWGNTDHDAVATRRLVVGPCPGGIGWIVFPGGFYVDKPRCISLIVRTLGREHQVAVGVGSPCTGQSPPPQPSDS